jgi:predicted acetyltransferase
VKQTHVRKSSRIVEVLPASPDQQPILANLVELYIHDFSEFHDTKIGADGKFGYNDLSLYWRDPNRHPLLVKVNGNLAGFALVRRISDISTNELLWDMAEFFVLRGHRRHGVGTAAALQVLRRFPGLWQVRVMQSNLGAHRFWNHAIAAFTGKPIESAVVEKNDKLWHYSLFESSGLAQQP